MFHFTEFHGESENDRRQRGTIEFQGEYVARRKPAWLVLGKLAAILFVVGFVYLLAVRHIDYPLLPLTAAYFGGLLIYSGIAYLVRPNPNDMNMGWGHGLLNDPTQYSDNVNRGLRDLGYFLQPGQLAVEAVLDLLILFGAHQAYDPTATEIEGETSSTNRVLSPDRFDRP